MQPIFNIALFGATGFIGGNICRYFRRRPAYKMMAFASADADLTNPESLPAVVERLRELPNLVLIMAATSDHSRLTPKKVFGANTRMAANIARLIARLHPAQVIYLSSIDVYGRPNQRLPLSEQTRPIPVTPYAQSKLQSERIISAQCRRKIPLAVLRLPGVYGPGDKSNRIIPAAIRAARQARRLVIAGDGLQRRDLLYVDDIARLSERIIRQRIAGTFNAVSGKSHSINQLVKIIEQIMKCPIKKKLQPEFKQTDLIFKPSRILQKTCFRFTAPRNGLTRILKD